MAKQLGTVVLHNTTPGHSKEYRVSVKQCEDGTHLVRTEWGRIDGPRRSKEVRFPTIKRAFSEAKLILRSKAGRGYEFHRAIEVVDPDWALLINSVFKTEITARPSPSVVSPEDVDAPSKNSRKKTAAPLHEIARKRRIAGISI